MLAGVRISGHDDVDVIDKRASAIVDVIDGAVLTVGSANKLNVMALKPFDRRGAAECVIVLVVKKKSEQFVVKVDDCADNDLHSDHRFLIQKSGAGISAGAAPFVRVALFPERITG